MRIHGTIEKVTKQDDGTLLVEGLASSTRQDKAGETVTADAMRKALPDYMQFANVREMHDSKKAAGVAVECEVNADDQTVIKALIVDPTAVLKVETGVYKGFSIGGRVTSRDKLNKKVIDGIELSEISLVDRPCNPDAVFTMCKVDGVSEDGDELPGEEEEVAKGDNPFPPKDDAKADEKDDDSEEGKKKKKAKKDEEDKAKDAEKVFAATVDGVEMQLRKRDDGSYEVVDDELAKGAYSIERLAQLAENLEYFASSRAYDVGSGTASAIPDTARKLAGQLYDLLIVLVSEDVTAAKQRIKDAGTKKVDDGGDLAKIAGLDTLQKAFDTLTAEHEDIVKKYAEVKALYEAAPAAPKGVLLTKTADATDTPTPEVKLIKVETPDGIKEVADPLSLMKNVHATGAVHIRP